MLQLNKIILAGLILLSGSLQAQVLTNFVFNGLTNSAFNGQVITNINGLTNGFVAIGGPCSTIHEENTQAIIVDFNWVGNDAGNYYNGQRSYTVASEIQVCKISVTLTGHGTITGNTYTCEVWVYNTSSPFDLQSQVGVSDGVSGAAWTQTVVDFTFSTPVTLSPGTTYAIVWTKNSAPDSSNKLQLHMTSNTAEITGVNSHWNSSRILTDAGGDDVKMIIYKQ